MDAADPIILLFSAKQDFHRLVIALFHLQDHLPTRSAGCHGLFGLLFSVSRSNGKDAYGLVGILRLGREDAGAFTAEPRREGCILLVCTDDGDAILQKYKPAPTWK